MYGEPEIKTQEYQKNEDGAACRLAVSIVQQWSNQLQVSKNTSPHCNRRNWFHRQSLIRPCSTSQRTKR